VVVQESPNRQHVTNDVTLYPNPAFDECTISYEGTLYAHANVAIYDITGRLMHTYLLRDNNAVIPLADLRAGMYQCRIDVDGKGIISRKLVVMK